MEQLNRVLVNKDKYDIVQNNEVQYGIDFILLIVIGLLVAIDKGVSILSKIFRTRKKVEDTFIEDVTTSDLVRKFVDSRIDKKIELHSLKKAPLIRDIELLKEQHNDLMFNIVESNKKFSDGINKLADRFDKIAEKLSEIDNRLARVETKVEDK